MRAGKLRHRLEIQQDKGTGVDSYGQPVEDWQTIETRWASVEPLQGRELLLAQQVNADINTRVRMRYVDGLTSEKRFKLNGRIIEIVTPPINPEERGAEHEIMCKETI